MKREYDSREFRKWSAAEKLRTEDDWLQHNGVLAVLALLFLTMLILFFIDWRI